MIEEDYDDMFAGLNDQITKNLFIRYYAMEEYFQIPPKDDAKQKKVNGEKMDEEMGNDIPQTKKEQSKKLYSIQGSAIIQQKEMFASGKKIAITLVYNKIIHETIFQLYIMNKLIHAKAKIATTLLENGKDISIKKDSFWNDFLNEEKFSKVKQAYSYLSEPKQKIIKYAVLSISNLLLKLGINMSKISVIPIQKPLTFQCLNIPVLSIIFLQFLQFRLFKSKKIQEQLHQSLFLRQLPKISVIKLSRFRNNTEIQQLETAQEIFFSKSSKVPIKNIQYIQIFQEEDPLYRSFARRTKYDNIISINLKQKFKIKAPYTFEILLLMRSFLFPLIRDFKPDLIVYYQSTYDNNMKIMDEEVRGLMICEMAEETACNKMYVIKQYGEWKHNYQEELMLEEKFGEGEEISQDKELIMCKIDEKRAKQMEKEKIASPQTRKYIRQMKSIILNDLCFISLALIQKTTFDSIEEASHRHFYQKQYLEGLLQEQKRMLQPSTYEKKDQQNFNRIMNNKIAGVKSMLQMLAFREKMQNKLVPPIINLMNQQTYFDSFYDFLSKCEQKLEVEGVDTALTYNEEDQLYVKYSEEKEKIIVFLIKENSMLVLSKMKDEEKMRKQREIVMHEWIEGSTLVASDRYLYRGFGKNKKDDKFNEKIQRFMFEPEFGNGWEIVGEKCTPIRSDGKQEEETLLERKIYGYGLYDAHNKHVLFMGGYLDSMNEQKISKTIHFIKNDFDEGKNQQNKKKIYSMGKTNKILFSGINTPLKNLFLHPFIFGLCFPTQGSAFILNTNGNYIGLNNNKKIFATNLKLSPVILYNGITIQKKLSITDNLEEMSKVLVEVQLLIRYLVSSNNHYNTFKNQSCLQTLSQGKVIITANSKQFQIQTEHDEEDLQEEIRIKFI